MTTLNLGNPKPKTVDRNTSGLVRTVRCKQLALFPGAMSQGVNEKMLSMVFVKKETVIYSAE